MKKYEMLITIGGGGVLVGAGIVMIILANLWGLLILLAGFAAVFYGYSKTMRSSGFDPNQQTYYAVPHAGNQQSEVAKIDQPMKGEQDATIWQQIEK